MCLLFLLENQRNFLAKQVQLLGCLIVGGGKAVPYQLFFITGSGNPFNPFSSVLLCCLELNCSKHSSCRGVFYKAWY